MAMNTRPNMKHPAPFKGSIGVDTKQTSYKPAKNIDYHNKMNEYKPNNQYYKTDFSNKADKPAPKPQQSQPQPKQQPKPQPKPQQKPQPKPAPKPEIKPAPQPQASPAPARVRPEPEPIRPQPEPVHEQWAEPVYQQPIEPIAAAAPVAIPVGSGMAVMLWPANKALRRDDKHPHYRDNAAVPRRQHNRHHGFYDRRHLPPQNYGCGCAFCSERERGRHHYRADHYYR